MTRAVRFLSAFVLAATAASCGPLRRGSGVPPAVVYFENQSLDQATVYVTGAGLDLRRIGVVFAGRTDTLTIPADLTMTGSSLNIVARLLARSEIPQTGPVSIASGGHYSVTLVPNGTLLSFLGADQ